MRAYTSFDWKYAWKEQLVHQHQDNRNLTDDNDIEVEGVSDKKGNEDK